MALSITLERVNHHFDPMTRPLLISLAFFASAFSGCDNRTRDDERWDQISETLKTDKAVQPFKQAKDPWSNAEHHEGVAW
jgi:hypothetical protein